MNLFQIGTPEHSSMERLKTLRMIGNHTDHVVSGLIEEIGHEFRRWSDAQVKSAVEDARDAALESVHREYEGYINALISSYDVAAKGHIEAGERIRARMNAALRSIRDGRTITDVLAQDKLENV